MSRFFYKYEPPRPLTEIETDIKQVEQEILELLKEVAG
jgi:type I restriction enzyme M protein